MKGAHVPAERAEKLIRNTTGSVLITYINTASEINKVEITEEL